MDDIRSLIRAIIRLSYPTDALDAADKRSRLAATILSIRNEKGRSGKPIREAAVNVLLREKRD